MGFLDSMFSMFSDVAATRPGEQQPSSNTPGELNLNNIKFVKSPNQGTRNGKVLGLVLHHTGPFSNTQSIVNWLCDPAAKASAHYVVGPAGDIVCLVKPEARAFHAGVSEWTFGTSHLHDLNQYTVGIEICNFGLLSKQSDGKIVYGDGRNVKEYHGETQEGSITFPNGKVLQGYYAPYPEAQIEAVVKLSKALIKKYPNITEKDIVTHYQIAPDRKNDPFGLNVQEVIKRIFS